MKPPPGGDQKRGWQLLATHSTLSGIATIVVFARLYTRITIVKSIGLDDYSIILAAVRRLPILQNDYIVTESSLRHPFLSH